MNQNPIDFLSLALTVRIHDLSGVHPRLANKHKFVMQINILRISYSKYDIIDRT